MLRREGAMVVAGHAHLRGRLQLQQPSLDHQLLLLVWWLLAMLGVQAIHHLPMQQSLGLWILIPDVAMKEKRVMLEDE